MEPGICVRAQRERSCRPTILSIKKRKREKEEEEKVNPISGLGFFGVCFVIFLAVFFFLLLRHKRQLRL